MTTPKIGRPRGSLCKTLVPPRLRRCSSCLQPNSLKSQVHFRLWRSVTFRCRHRMQLIPRRGESTWADVGQAAATTPSSSQRSSEHRFDRFFFFFLVCACEFQMSLLSYLPAGGANILQQVSQEGGNGEGWKSQN